MSAPKKLFEPIKVGNVELKNRVMMLGVTTGFLDNYYVTDKYANFMGARARGGTGLVVIGSAYPFDLSGVTPRYINIASGVGIWTDDQIPGLSKVAKNIHDNGGKAACQLVICSEWRANKDNPLEGVGPSAGAGGPSVKEVRELTVDEIRLIVDQYGEGARRAREAGFDLVITMEYSHFEPLARIAPEGREGQMFGLYVTTGRAVSWMAPAAFAALVAIFGTDRAGIGGIALVLLVGMVLFALVPKHPAAPAVEVAEART